MQARVQAQRTDILTLQLARHRYANRYSEIDHSKYLYKQPVFKLKQKNVVLPFKCWGFLNRWRIRSISAMTGGARLKN